MRYSLIKKQIPQKISAWFIEYSIPLKLFFFSRMGLFLLVYLGLIFIPIFDVPGQWRSHPENLFLDGWSRWDSGWYSDISKYGYSNKIHSGVGQDTAFFPMYPILVSFLNLMIHDSHLSGILVSNVSFFFALIVLFRLLSDRYGTTIAERTLILISFNPFSFFFSAVYTESVFLLSVVCSFYFCEQKKYLLAAFWAAVAGATRFVGLITVVGLVTLYLEQIKYDWRRIKPNILVFSIGLLGTIFYMLFLAVKYGNPLQFLDSQDAWGSLNPLNSIAQTINSLSYHSIMTGAYPAMNLIHLLILLASVFLLLAYRKKIGLPYTVFSIMVIAVSFPRINGMGRYLMVVFPLFVAATFFLKNNNFYLFFLYINILLLAMFSIMFSHWYWVA